MRAAPVTHQTHTETDIQPSAVIASVNTCRSFRNLARYLERPKTGREHKVRVDWIETRFLILAEDLEAAAREMSIVASGSDRVQSPVLHASVSWAPDDNPTREQMQEVADGLLDTLGMKDHQAIFVAHADEDYAHLHIMANRVHPHTRKAVKTYMSWFGVEEYLRRAERRMGFREVPGHLYQLEGQKRPDRSQSLSKGAYKGVVRDGMLPFQMLVRRAAGDDFENARSWEELVRRLRGNGLELQARKRGLVVTDGAEYAKSSSVMPGISARKLAERFGETFAEYERRVRAPVLELKRAHEARLERGKAESGVLSSEADYELARGFLRLKAEGRAPELRRELGESAYDALSRLAVRSSRGRER